MFKKLATDFDPSSIEVDKLMNIPVFEIIYGKKQDYPLDKLCWIKYKTTDPSSEISFTRNTYNFMPNEVELIVNYLKSICRPSFEQYIIPEKVHFIRTIGYVDPHTDEKNRRCCINIGLKNTNSAVTRMYDSEDMFSLPEEYQDFQCQDGGVYLIDTSKAHAVLGNSDVPRILVTYGFDKKFSIIKSEF